VLLLLLSQQRWCLILQGLLLLLLLLLESMAPDRGAPCWQPPHLYRNCCWY
jgi:hypothetical protein